MILSLRRSHLLLVVFALALPLQAQLLTRETKQLNLVYYDKAHEYLTYHLARSFENSLGFHERLFDYKPTEPITILMQDFGDFGHGGTSTVPWNYLSIGIEPFDYVYETMPANERMNWLMHHELMHVVATDKGADEDLMFRKAFHGKVAPIKEEPISMFYSWLTSPRWYSPRWYHEGIAVFLETWMAGGSGRVLGGYDEMVFRTMDLEHAYFFDVVGLESEGTTIDFQVGQNSYLYGTRFMTYLAQKYGPEKLIAWVNRSHGSRRYFSSQFRNVYGVSLDAEWRNWIADEHKWQKANLDLIRKYPVTELKPVTHETLGSVSRSYYDPERKLIYAAINRPAQPAQVAAIDVESGKITPLTEVVGPALYFVSSLAYDAKGRKLFYTTHNGTGWRSIYEIDLATGQKRLLLDKVRTGDLVVDPTDQSIWGIQHHNGFSSIIRIPPPYKEWKNVLSLDYGRDIFDLDISPDGKTLAAGMIDVTGRQQLIAMNTADLMSGNGKFETLHEFENNSPENFTFSPDGRYLYGTSYYTGVSNVFRYDMVNRKMEAVSNVESGLFRPIPIAPDKLLAYRYTAAGFVPVTLPVSTTEDVSAINYLGQQVVEKFPIVKTWNAGSPARIDLDKVTTYAGPYLPWREERLGTIYPVVEGYKGFVTAGMRVNMSDPLALNSFDFTAGVTLHNDVPSNERFHAKLGWEHSPWSVKLRYNATDFYDLFGPVRVSRKGESASVSFHNFLVYDKPRTLEYTVAGAAYAGLDTLPDYQNIATTIRQYQTFRAHLDFADLRKTIGAVDYEKGDSWTLAASGNHVTSSFFPQVYANYDRGFLLPAPHTSLWLRTSAGKSWGDRSNPFANFYFGAFGNNYVDYRDERRYRNWDSFPGVELDALGGADFVHEMAELTLPAIRFEKMGVPAMYANWLRFALFGSVLSTDVTKSALRQNSWDAGVQADLSLVAFSNLESMLSVGYARAHQKNFGSSNEWMVSLKLLK